MNYELPKSVRIGGADYKIRSDFRAILDICAALEDIELKDGEKAEVAIKIFYPEYESIPLDQLQEAVEQCFLFINCGKEEPNKKPAPKLIDWQQDFQYIIAPVNRVCGKEVRAVEYMHWWTFIAYYQEIGDCTFRQIVNVRYKKAYGKKLEKNEQEWYKRNRDMIDIRQKLTEEEGKMLAEFGIK